MATISIPGFSPAPLSVQMVPCVAGSSRHTGPDHSGSKYKSGVRLNLIRRVRYHQCTSPD